MSVPIPLNGEIEGRSDGPMAASGARASAGGRGCAFGRELGRKFRGGSNKLACHVAAIHAIDGEVAAGVQDGQIETGGVGRGGAGDGEIGGEDNGESRIRRLGGAVAANVAGVRRRHPEGDPVQRR